MPQTQSTNGPSLGIRLERGQPNFTLPDTVTGHVYSSTRVVTSKAIVTIALVGRSKSRMVVRHGSWGRTYRGRFALVDESEHTHKLFEAPLHIPVNGEEKMWPFAITLPTHFDATKTASGTPQDESYLSLTPGEPATHTLPSSFAVQKWGYGEGMECFVEYFLRAELTTINRGSTVTERATQLLAITTLYHGPRRGDARWLAFQYPHSLMRNETLIGYDPVSEPNSSGQRTDSHQSRLDFAIIVKIPALLQLSQSSPISLLLLAVPMSPLSSDSALLTSKEISLTEISVALVASTSIKCRGRRRARDANTETRFRLWNKEIPHDLVPIIIPWREQLNSTNENSHNANATSTSHGTSQALDAGIRLGLRNSDDGIFESFSTHNIQHSHRLEWKITIAIAGQTFSLSGGETVKLVAPNSEDMPVEYETLQNELMMERSQSIDAEAVPPEYTHEQPLPPRAPRQTGGAFGLSRLWDGV